MMFLYGCWLCIQFSFENGKIICEGGGLMGHQYAVKFVTETKAHRKGWNIMLFDWSKYSWQRITYLVWIILFFCFQFFSFLCFFLLIRRKTENDTLLFQNLTQTENFNEFLKKYCFFLLIKLIKNFYGCKIS